MRLLFVVTEDWAFLRHRLPMARAALNMGLTVAVATRVSDHGDAIRALGIKVFDIPVDRAGISPLKDLGYLNRLKGVMRSYAPDLVHNIAAKPILYGSLAARRAAPRAAVINAFTGLGILFTGDAKGRRSAKGRVLGAVLMTALRCLCVRNRVHMLVQNKDDRAFLEGHRIGRPERTHLIPGSGVDLDLFPQTPPPPAPPVRAVLVGRLLKTKGVEEFAQAARLLKTKRRDDIRLILVGAPDPGNPTTVAEADLDAWKSEGVLDWSGETADIAGVWAGAHIAVLPSYREGMPKSLLEAAAAGRPMIATDVPGCRDLVRAGETGVLVPPFDAAALADAIERLADDGELRSQMGRAAHLDVERVFGAIPVGKAIAELYGHALKLSATITNDGEPNQ